jgi:hypothetical protein
MNKRATKLQRSYQREFMTWLAANRARFIKPPIVKVTVRYIQISFPGLNPVVKLKLTKNNLEIWIVLSYGRDWLGDFSTHPQWDKDSYICLDCIEPHRSANTRTLRERDIYEPFLDFCNSELFDSSLILVCDDQYFVRYGDPKNWDWCVSFAEIVSRSRRPYKDLTNTGDRYEILTRYFGDRFKRHDGSTFGAQWDRAYFLSLFIDEKGTQKTRRTKKLATDPLEYFYIEPSPRKTGGSPGSTSS